MPTFVAIEHDRQIKAFYQRLCLSGKSKMTILIDPNENSSLFFLAKCGCPAKNTSEKS